MERGRCRTTAANPDWFHPEPGKNNYVTAARFVCAGCPVNSQCLAFGLDNMGTHEVGTHGIWGGTTYDERRVLLGKSSKHKASA